MKKAEKIFRDTYYECRKHIKDWGVEYNPNGTMVAYATLITEEVVYTRTCNEVQKYIDSERKRLEMNDRFGIGTPESQQFQKQALEMTQQTLDNQRKHNSEL